MGHGSRPKEIAKPQHTDATTTGTDADTDGSHPGIDVDARQRSLKQQQQQRVLTTTGLNRPFVSPSKQSKTSLLRASLTPPSRNGSMPCLVSLASSPLANVHALMREGAVGRQDQQHRCHRNRHSTCRREGAVSQPTNNITIIKTLNTQERSRPTNNIVTIATNTQHATTHATSRMLDAHGTCYSRGCLNTGKTRDAHRRRAHHPFLYSTVCSCRIFDGKW